MVHHKPQINHIVDDINNLNPKEFAKNYLSEMDLKVLDFMNTHRNRFLQQNKQSKLQLMGGGPFGHYRDNRNNSDSESDSDEKLPSYAIKRLMDPKKRDTQPKNTPMSELYGLTSLTNAFTDISIDKDTHNLNDAAIEAYVAPETTTFAQELLESGIETGTEVVVKSAKITQSGIVMTKDALIVIAHKLVNILLCVVSFIINNLLIPILKYTLNFLVDSLKQGANWIIGKIKTVVGVILIMFMLFFMASYVVDINTITDVLQTMALVPLQQFCRQLFTSIPILKQFAQYMMNSWDAILRIPDAANTITNVGETMTNAASTMTNAASTLTINSQQLGNFVNGLNPSIESVVRDSIQNQFTPLLDNLQQSSVEQFQQLMVQSAEQSAEQSKIIGELMELMSNIPPGADQQYISTFITDFAGKLATGAGHALTQGLLSGNIPGVPLIGNSGGNFKYKTKKYSQTKKKPKKKTYKRRLILKSKKKSKPKLKSKTKLKPKNKKRNKNKTKKHH